MLYFALGFITFPYVNPIKIIMIVTDILTLYEVYAYSNSCKRFVKLESYSLSSFLKVLCILQDWSVKTDNKLRLELI